MMPCLLGKMEQQTNNNRQHHTAEHSRNNENDRNIDGERFVHRAANSRGSASRPLFPTFTPREEQPHAFAAVSFRDEARQTYLEYTTLPPDMRELWTFDQFINQRSRRGGRNDHYAPPRTDYQQALGKLTMPYFDGSNKRTARAWVQKLDNYLSLRPMLEEDAIRFATIHLEGAAHEWWYHGLITLFHNLITIYDEFTNRLIERFDDLEVSFHELAQLKQHGTLET